MMNKWRYEVFPVPKEIGGWCTKFLSLTLYGDGLTLLEFQDTRGNARTLRIEKVWVRKTNHGTKRYAWRIPHLADVTDDVSRTVILMRKEKIIEFIHQCRQTMTFKKGQPFT